TLLREFAVQGASVGRILVKPEAKVPQTKIRLNRAIELKNVSFRYPASEVEAVKDLTLSIPARATVGFVGVTGSGKTTLVDLMLGLLRPQSGQMLVDGTPISDEN